MLSKSPHWAAHVYDLMMARTPPGNSVSGFTNHEVDAWDMTTGSWGKKQVPLPVNSWSHDGIHVTNPDYVKKYINRYAFGIIKKIGLLYN